MIEIWKTVTKYPKYEVSNLGNVKNIKSGLLKKLTVNKSGYFMVNLYKDNMCRPEQIAVHRLVAWEFIGEQTSIFHVNHINGIKTDNSIKNLEYVTRQENVSLAWKNGQIKPLKGEDCGKSKLCEISVKEIRNFLKSGLGQAVIAKKYNVTQANISSIKNNLTWKHI